MAEGLGATRLKVSVEERIAVVRLSDLPRHNAMSLPMREELMEALRSFEQEDCADAVVITGDGSKAFSAGADINEVAERTVAGELATRAQLRRELPRLLESMRLPTVAAISGYCLGAGLEVALACTVRIAAEDATLGLPEINLGVIPGSGGTQRLARLIGMGRAMEMVTLGEPIDAAEAWRIGLVNRVCAAGQLLPEAISICRKWQSKGPVSLMAARDAVLRSADFDLASGLDYENKLFALAIASGERDEGVKAFREKRKPRFRASAKDETATMPRSGSKP